MGRLYKPVLGRASGKVGDIVFRCVDGKVFITSHKGTNKISSSPACVNNRSRFSTVVNFAKAVNNLPDLKCIWSKSPVKGINSYSKIISKNIKAISENLITKSNMITPSGFSLYIDDVLLSTSEVSLSFLIGEKSAAYSGLSFKSNFVIAFYEPVEPETKPPLVISLQSSVTPSANNYVDTSAIYDNTARLIYPLYKNAMVFFAITKTDNPEGPDLFSRSYAFDISL
jgi:hypothetical protein